MKEKAKAARKKKEEKKILHFSSASDIQPPPGKQGLNLYSTCSGRKTFL